MGILGQTLTGNTSKDQYNRYRRDNRALFDAQGDALGRARSIAGRAYQGYDGQRVAGLSGNERQAMTMAQQASTGPAREYLSRAGQTIDSVANDQWNSETAQRYMNPYTDQVLDRQLRRVNEQYGADLETLKGQAASRGAFGGDRQTLLESNLRRDHMENVADVTAEGYYNAYNDASRMWLADNDRRLRASDAYRAVGGDISRMDSAQITDLIRTGESSRLLEQMQMDADYNAFIERRDWDVTNLQPLLAAIGASREGASFPATQSSNAGQMIGAVASIIGMFGGGGGASATTGSGMGTAAPVTGYQGSGMGDYWAGGNSGVMLS